MSRIGKQPVKIPEGVEVKLDGDVIVVKGAKGELKETIHSSVKVEVKDKQVLVNSLDKALWGLFRSLIQNMVVGVVEGYEKKLEIIGVGFKSELKDGTLTMSLGFSHPVVMEVPEGLTLEVKDNNITVSGIDKQAVGEFAAKIRDKKKPEPYKGKGIKYQDERIIRKAGKAGAKK